MEANINDGPPKLIDEILDDWKVFCKNTQNDLVLFYKVGKVNIIEVIVANVPSVLEVLPAGNRKRDFIEIVSYA